MRHAGNACLLPDFALEMGICGLKFHRAACFRIDRRMHNV